MLIKTRYFGEIDLQEDKILTFEQGILGFEECKKFTILYDNTDEVQPNISWFQSIDNYELALPVIYPSLVMEDYNPIVNDDSLKALGELNNDNIVILLTLTVPSDLTKMTTNLKAPIIINSETKCGCQLIAENDDYMIKYPVYDKFNKELGKKGDM